MLVHISYPRAALHEAARFIWENNTSVTRWPNAPKNVFDVMSHIHELMVRSAKDNARILLKEKLLKQKFDDEWHSYTGTGGYYLLLELEDESVEGEVTIGFTILVDPSVGHSDPSYHKTLVGEVFDFETTTV